MKQIPFYHTRLDGGFWGEKQRISKDVTVDAVYDRFSETKRFAALKCDAAQQEREGWRCHFFWDSDIAKWIEGAAYILERGRNEALEARTDAIIDDMCANQMEDGYYNCYFKIYETDDRFRTRDHHELYCLGHLIEAAIAYHHATGKDKLLGLVERYVDYVIRVFTVEKSAGFVTPGHEEIELALVKLYRATGKQKYLELSKFFVDNRGANDLDPASYCHFATANYAQDHLPVREQTTAEGHSVRAMYLYIAMADLALECSDEALFHACEAILGNVANKRMYITGGVGSSYFGEAFTVDYDLKNEPAYTETCATLAFALFCQRMSKIKPMGWYADTAELAMYNGSISGVSMAGDEFFYENPLTIDLADHDKNPATKDKERYPITQRVKVFGCSCCPPNILRFINAIGDFLYTEDGDTLYVHHYMNGTTEYEGKTIRQTTAYPSCGKVKLEFDGYRKIAVRVPGWCSEFEASAPYEMRDGYAYFDAVSALDLDFHIRPRLVVSAPGVHDNAGRTALVYGPVVYCLEGVDHEDNIFTLSINPKTAFTLTPDDYFGMPVITADGYRKVDNGQLYTAIDAVKYEERKLHFIPYYAMENRGETDMQVWIPMKV
ncbi:MAG: glycoside hydrolase family 127 protein [Clostridia bacterium]|nr:glycoside hydrolase family 127 protein [Clostridia bacterium]